jgi:hypothetical protein
MCQNLPGETFPVETFTGESFREEIFPGHGKREMSSPFSCAGDETGGAWKTDTPVLHEVQTRCLTVEVDTLWCP